MHVGIIGPLCKDEIIIKGKKRSQLGGVTYYTGNALASLGADVSLFATYGNESAAWLKPLSGCRIIHLKRSGTITYINEYPEDNPDTRIQRATIPENRIREEDINDHLQDLSQLEYIILGPLFHDNFSAAIVRKISSCAPIILAQQGMIRYLNRDRIVWRHPEKVHAVLPFVQYVFVDEKELAFLSGHENITRGVKSLQGMGAANIIVTKGSQGSTIFMKEKTYAIPAFPPAQLQDPTGAGDSYLAGFVRTLGCKLVPQQRGEFAAMVATMSIEQNGAFRSSLSEVLGRLGWASLEPQFQDEH